MVTMLLQGGVDMDARDEDGQSPLLLAVRGRYQGPGCCSRHEEVDGGLFLWGNLEGLHGGGGLRSLPASRVSCRKAEVTRWVQLVSPRWSQEQH